MSIAREREENNAALTGWAALQNLGMPPGHIAKAVLELSALSRRLRKIAENQCNGYRDAASEKRDATKQEKARGRVREIARKLEVSRVDFNGDPRGAAVRLIADWLPHNNLGGGYAVI